MEQGKKKKLAFKFAKEKAVERGFQGAVVLAVVGSIAAAWRDSSASKAEMKKVELLGEKYKASLTKRQLKLIQEIANLNELVAHINSMNERVVNSSSVGYAKGTRSITTEETESSKEAGKLSVKHKLELLRLIQEFRSTITPEQKAIDEEIQSIVKANNSRRSKKTIIGAALGAGIGIVLGAALSTVSYK